MLGDTGELLSRPARPPTPLLVLYVNAGFSILEQLRQDAPKHGSSADVDDKGGDMKPRRQPLRPAAMWAIAMVLQCACAGETVWVDLNSAAEFDAAPTPDAAPDSNPRTTLAESSPFSTLFAETNWDIARWLEYDGAPGGAGPAAGLVQQAGALTIAGNGKWGANGLATVLPWSRALGDLHFSATVTPKACDGVLGYALGFGEFSHAAYNSEFPGASYRVYAIGGQFHLRYNEWQPGKDKEVPQQVTLKGGSCVPGKAIELHLLVHEGRGASAWIGADSAGAVAVKEGVFDLKPLWLQHYSAGTTMTVSAAAAARPVALPGTPTDVTVIQAGGKALVQWSAVKQNGSAINDYAIRCTEVTGLDLPCDTSQSPATSAELVLPPGQAYQVRVAAKNGMGQGIESAPFTFMPLADQPVAPVAFQVGIDGELAKHQILQAHYTFADGNGDPADAPQWRWQVAATASGPFADLADSGHRWFSPGPAEQGNWLRVGVLPVAKVAPFIGQWSWSPPAGPVAAEKPYLNHILSTGQSLSLGGLGVPALTVLQPYQNVGLSGTQLVPLVEATLETPSSAMANYLTQVSPGQSWDYAVTRHGVPATLYIGLSKGTAPFEEGMQQVKTVAAAAMKGGQIARVAAVTAIHGEADGGSGWAGTYAKNLQQWQADYQQEVFAITGQSGTLPLFTDQTSSFGYLSAGPGIALAQHQASLAKPNAIYLVGPKYHLTYPDGLHLNAASYRQLGANFGKVMGRVLFQGEVWRPLSPLAASRKGKVVTVKMHVPNPPLVLDADLVLKRSQFGFDYLNSKQSIAVTAVSVTATEVSLTLATEPTYPGERLRYACVFTPKSGSGALVADAPGGNLRDSDTSPGPDGKPLYNWAIHFDVAVAAEQ